MSRKALSIRELSPEEIRAFLAAQHVGRLAYSFHDRVDIVPVHFVHDEGWLYGRTSFGPKLVTLGQHHWVAFEVDDVRDAYHWTSVVARGTFHAIDAADPVHQDTYAHALDVLRRGYPDALTEDDVVPFRTVLFRIHVDEATGRAGTLIES